MMRLGTATLLVVLLPCLAPARSKAPPTVEAANQKLEIRATLYKHRADIRRVLGTELEKGIVVVKVTITPKNGQPINVERDNFLLRSDKDGEKSDPYDPGQIAGKSVLTVVYSDEGGGTMEQQQGPVWGGMGGGMPGRLPGMGSRGVGNAPGVKTATNSRVEENKSDSDNKLLTILKKKVLPEGKTATPVTGLLYFPLEGKHKDKQLWLYYISGAHRLSLRFKHKKR